MNKHLKFLLQETLTIVLIITVFTSKAQDIPKTFTDEELDKWAVQYEDEEVVAHTITREFEFKPNTSQKVITATESLEEYWIQLEKKNTDIRRSAYYDGSSSIESVKGKGGKKFEYHSKMKIGGIFHHDFYRCRYGIDIKNRNIIHMISMSKNYTDTRYLTSAYFQTDHIVLNSVIRFKIPATVKVGFVEYNFEGYDIKKKTYKEGAYEVIEYSLKDLDKIPEDVSAPGMSFYAPHILIISKSITSLGEEVLIMGNTQDQYNWYRGLLKGSGNDNNVLKKIVKELTEGITSEKGKMEVIFYWVQDNIRYIAFEEGLAGFQPESCQEVYNNKYGDCKGMANIMTEMLRLSGIDARMSWIGTKKIAYDYSVASLAVDNHAICTAILDGKYYFLDGTEKYIAMEDYAERIQGRQVLIEDGEKYQIKKVPSFDFKRNLEATTLRISIDDLKLKGNIELTYNGESKIRLLNLYNSLFNEHKELAKQYLIIGDDNNIHVKNVKSSDLTKRRGEKKISAEVTIENKAFKFGEEIFVDFDLYKEFMDYDLDSNRSLAYWFTRKIYKTNETYIATPVGYKIKTTPPNISEVNEDFSIIVTYKPSIDGKE